LGHGHDHGALSGRRRSSRALLGALGLTLAFLVVEVVGGVVSGSLALLADAGHMLSDAGALGLAVGAAWLAARPATPDRSFGYRRAEVLAALANGVALVAIAIWIAVEALVRLGSPPEVEAGPVLVIGLLGLAVNAAAARILWRVRDETLNAAAAFRHVLADALGSAGVILSGVVLATTGWEAIDPLVSLAIAGLILLGSWSVLRASVDVLLESAPAGIPAEEVGAAIAGVPGVEQAHDLHIWTITSGFVSLSAHVVVGRDQDCHERRRAVEAMLHDRFGIAHVTLQMDHAGSTGEFVPLSDIRRGDPRDSP
jgi:cobalt-zinc-cadmium efflux system protein